ncbi:MAG: DUF2852 domain-containing protein [Hyphomicrobiales bacterium]|nr:DUF2852 domain-containing protein [Hyphomicrobiales bacterium]
MTTIESAEIKLDQWGMGAWIALMVVGFVLWWPVGLAVLAYLVWSGRMRCWKRDSGHGREAGRNPAGWWGTPSSGNRAFDEYRAETLRRLEEEQREFKEFLERLRFARDKTEFDQFMAERRSRTGTTAPDPATAPQT